MPDWLARADKLTKWAVASTAFTVGALHTDFDIFRGDGASAATSGNGSILPAYYLSCALATAMCGKYIVKPLINEKRPEGSKKLSQGMPSSHATSLSFLAGAACVGLLHYDAWGVRSLLLRDGDGAAAFPWRAAAAVLIVSLPTAALFLSWLRIRQGHHTWPQVAVGLAYGSSGCAVATWCETQLLNVNAWPYTAKRRLVVSALVVASTVGTTWVRRARRKWAHERREREASKQ